MRLSTDKDPTIYGKAYRSPDTAERVLEQASPPQSLQASSLFKMLVDE